MKRVIVVFATLLLISACDQENQSNQVKTGQANKQPYQSLLVYPVKKPLPAFALVNHQSQAFDVDGFAGKWNLLFMGFTHCPDVCPTTLMDMNRIYQAMAPEIQSNLQVVFLSVDPKRDTPEFLGQYIEHFNDDFIAVTGSSSEIDKLVGALGGLYVINNEDPEYYTVDHTAKIFIIDPQGRRYGIITSESMHHSDKAQLIKDLTDMASPKS